MELLKDYDITILYHPGKANVVADALSRKAGSMGSLAHLQASRRPLAREVQTLANKLEKKRSLGVNFIFNMMRTMMGVIIPLITFPYSSRVLGPEALGIIIKIQSELTIKEL